MEPTLTAGQLLDVWEQGRFQTPAQRAFSLLLLAVPAASSEALGGYGIGQRDQELLRLRERIFGPCLTGAAQCPACGLEIELDVSVAGLCAHSVPAGGQVHSLQTGEYVVRFRLPTCDDLTVFAANGGLNTKVLLQLCVTEASRNGAAMEADQLPGEAATALSQRMAELDPQGDIQLALACPNCSRPWELPLDIASFLWNEIHAWAGRILREVHSLALAYGWREADILAMSPERRHTYLEMIRQ